MGDAVMACMEWTLQSTRTHHSCPCGVTCPCLNVERPSSIPQKTTARSSSCTTAAATRLHLVHYTPRIFHSSKGWREFDDFFFSYCGNGSLYLIFPLLPNANSTPQRLLSPSSRDGIRRWVFSRRQLCAPLLRSQGATWRPELTPTGVARPSLRSERVSSLPAPIGSRELPWNTS